MAEDFMRETDTPVPFELKKISRIIYDYRKRGGAPETVWLVDENWKPTADQKKAKLKAIVDVHVLDTNEVLYLSDYKSGREYSSHRTQLELYGLMGLMVYPEAKRVESSAVYIDGGFQGAEGSIIRDMIPHYQKRWEEKIIRIEADTAFLAAPSAAACRWCPYSKSKGGPCGESSRAGV
jgi:RecB family exonuclease